MKINITTVAILLFIIFAGLALIFFAMLQANTSPATNEGDNTELSESETLPDGPSEGTEAGSDEAPDEPVANNNNEAPEAVACTMDAKQCPDGSYVGRTGPNCEFAACPLVEADADVEADPVVCTMDVKECPDGSYVSRQAPSCQFAACPVVIGDINNNEPVACTADVKQCPDGSYVSRQAPSCQFAACPVQPLNLQFQAN